MNKDSHTEDIQLDSEAQEQLKRLVLQRINIMPSSIRMAVGNTELEKADVITHVRNESEIGLQVMQMELHFLRDLASGAVYVEADN